METDEPINKKDQAKAVPDESRPPAEPAQPPPPDVEAIPATGVTGGGAPATQTLVPYVQHLAPESFPGRLRGLYGGSLWLEPSFDGLQWPYMAHTGVGVSGNFWLDSGYETIKRDRMQYQDGNGQTHIFQSSSMYLMQGRGVLRVTPTYVHGRFFVQGQAELVGNLCQATNDGSAVNPAVNTVCTSAGTFSTDDLWIRVGHWNIWDLKVGRFEGWEIYHLGMGMDQYTLERMGAGMFGLDDTRTGQSTSPAQLEAPSLYGVNYLHDRPTDGLAVGYIALHAYVTQWLRFENLVKLGSNNYRNDSSPTTPGVAPTLSLGAAQSNEAGSYFGERLTAILDVGSSKFKFKLKIGGEYQKRTPVMQDPYTSPNDMSPKDPVANNVQEGVGASMQFVIDPFVEFGVNAAIGRQEYTNAYGSSPNGPNYTAAMPSNYTTKSVGGFANFRLADLWLVGLGLNLTEQTDQYKYIPTGVGDYTSHLQGFAALQYLLGGQLFIKATFGFAKAYFQPSDPSLPIDPTTGLSPKGSNDWSNYMYSGRIRLMYIY
jgi:hypothetical protein